MLQDVISTLLFQLFLAALATAAPTGDLVSTTAHGNTWTYGTGGGILGFVVLILDIIVWIEVLKSDRSPLSKVLWCAVVFLFPIVGMIIYWLFSDRAAHNGSASYEPVP